MMKLLIAPWRNSSDWKEVIYEFDRREVISSTSLKILQKNTNPDKTIISLFKYSCKKGRNYQEVKANAEEKIKEYADKFGLVNYEVC